MGKICYEKLFYFSSKCYLNWIGACMQEEKAVDKKAPVEESAHAEEPTDVEELSSEEVNETKSLYTVDSYMKES